MSTFFIDPVNNLFEVLCLVAGTQQQNVAGFF